MSLGGLALAIGILVDEATVTLENTHAQMRHTDSIARAARQANATTATARLLAMLCILSVFIPTFILNEPVRSLFMPLTLSVGFSMIASYLLSSTLVPVASVWLIKHRGEATHQEGFFDRILPRFAKIVDATVRRCWLLVPTYLVACGLLFWLVGRQVGTELFPQVDSGQFVLRFRTPPGSEYELTRKCALKVLEVIEEQTQGKVAISMGYVGLGATNTATNNILLFMRGTDDAQLRVRLQEGSGIRLAELRERLRQVLPEQVVPWLKRIAGTGRVLARGSAGPRAKSFLRFRAGRHRQHGNELRLADAGRGRGHRPGAKRGARSRIEDSGRDEETFPASATCSFISNSIIPTVRVDVDRQKAGLSGVAVKDVTDALLVGTSSSRYVAKNYWRDPKSGVDYQVQVQVPAQRMNRPQQVETLPLQKVNPDTNLMVRDVAKVQTGTTPGEIDRSAMQRYLSITANIEGSDLGRATDRIERAIAAAGEPPRGVRVTVRGQVAPMTEMFHSLGHWPGPFGRSHSRLVDRLLPIVPPGTDFHRRRPRRGLRRGHHFAGDGNDAEHRVVHGLDHVHRRLRIQFGAAVDLHGRPLAGRGNRTEGRRRGSP